MLVRKRQQVRAVHNRENAARNQTDKRAAVLTDGEREEDSERTRERSIARCSQWRQLLTCKIKVMPMKQKNTPILNVNWLYSI